IIPAMPQPVLLVLWIIFVLVAIPLPVGTDHPRRRFPWATYGLIAVNILVFLVQLVKQSSEPGYNPFLQWGLVPVHPHLTTLFTNLFLHVGLSHILWNMAFLWLFGRDVEDALGHLTFLILYFGGGVAAGLLHMAIVLLFAENTAVAASPLVGASGAISAVLGFFAIRFYGSKINLYWVGANILDSRWARLEIPAISGLAPWLGLEIWGAVLSLFHPDGGGTAYWSHIGGFIFGMVGAVLTDMLGEGAREYLLTEAKEAKASGDQKGLAAAVRRYWVILQRRPADEETHAALEELVQQAAQAGSGGAQALAAECSALLDVSMALDDRPHALAWYREMRACGFDPPLPPRTLAFLAEGFLQVGDYSMASRLYHRLLNRFPDAPEAEWTYLELATLLIGHLNDSADAAMLLQSFLEKYPVSTHRELAINLLDSAAGRTPMK
ncbi:MAG TPA: rhomboid family intramembrane serine protease, partial [Capsulimonadaceae bacterium]|nr:rhomboid family intramembrane serine protease [Capsulimonadaceae bacterium]